MNRPMHIIAGVVAAAATITLVWMPSVNLAGITATAIDRGGRAMTRSLRLIVGAVVAAALVGLAWLTPAILAGITFNAID